MRKPLVLSVLVFLAFASAQQAGAQDQAIISPRSGQPQGYSPVEPIKITLSPAPAPLPALKYRLLPEERDLEVGNAALLYYRAFSPEWVNNYNRPEVNKAIEDWDPEKGLPKGLDFVLNDEALKEIDLAARRTHCDWELLPRLRKEGIALLIPDLQGFRRYVRLLAARARLEMAAGKHKQAVYTLQTGMSFSRHVSDGPILIQSLVGIALSSVTLQEVEQFIQKKDSPNLYWALTDLPRPFIDLRKPLQGEKIMFDQLFPGLREMAQHKDARPMSPEEFDHYLEGLFKMANNLHLVHSDQFFHERLAMALVAAKVYPEAKKFLLAQGRSPKVVEKMPVALVALLYEVYSYDRHYDDMIKWYGFPYLQARAGLTQARKDFELKKMQSGSVGLILAGMLMPAVDQVYQAAYRVERKIATLRCVEALRLYTATHAGKLPASLKDITEVPVPLDPLTGNAFQYQLRGDTAVLTAPVPAGESPNPRSNTWVYEITLRR